MSIRKPAPAGASIVVNRVKSNEEWFIRCQVLHKEEWSNIGKFARQVRKRSNISLRSLATKMGVSAVYLSDLERGNRGWNQAVAVKWAAALTAAEGRVA